MYSFHERKTFLSLEINRFEKSVLPKRQNCCIFDNCDTVLFWRIILIEKERENERKENYSFQC